jgi:hypothetical protein
MGVGPNEMVDLEFLQDRADERSAPRAGGIGFLERGECAGNSEERGRSSEAGKTPNEHDLARKITRSPGQTREFF